MAKRLESAALDQWYVVEAVVDVGREPRRQHLLGRELMLSRDCNERVAVVAITTGDDAAKELPTCERYGYVWTTLGHPAQPVVDIPEADESDRQYVPCGPVAVNASGLRIVENFLDMAHFPFVHTGILEFFQPQAAMSATGGIITRYIYRVTSPFVTLLYKSCPLAPTVGT
jgi:3-Ketosteroid 9alpha-hydroxylase C-terminal domain